MVSHRTMDKLGALCVDCNTSIFIYKYIVFSWCFPGKHHTEDYGLTIFFIKKSASRCIPHTAGRRGHLVLRNSVPHFPPNSECMFSDGTLCRALPRHQSQEMIILNISFSRLGIESTICCVYSHALYLCAMVGYFVILLSKLL